MSNLKQIGLGMMMYTQDYDGRYAPAIEGNYPDSNTYVTQSSSPGVCDGKPCDAFVVRDGTSSTYFHLVTWMDIVYPYVKSTNLFYCPSQKHEPYPNYGYNYYISRMIDTTKPPVSMAQFNNPSQTVLLMDCRDDNSIYARPVAGVFLPETGNKNFAPHIEGYNVTFVDGHVKWFGKNNPVGLQANINTYWNDIAP